MTAKWWEVLQETVRFMGLERLDLADIRAMQDIQVGQQMETLGALMGNSEGALSTPVGTLTNNGAQWFLDIGPFQFFMSFDNRSSDGNPIRSQGLPDNLYGEDGIKSKRGVVLSHDPKDAGQNSRVNVTDLLTTVQSSYDTNGIVWDDVIYPYLFVRPQIVPTESDARQFWSVTSGAEEAATINTRNRIRFEFYLGVTRPDIASDEAPYVKVARILRWFPDTNFSGGSVPKPEIPILYPISVWDSDESARFVKHPGNDAFDGSIDGLRNPLGVAPTSIQISRSSQFGAAPVPAGSNASVFMSPFPEYTNGEGFNWGGGAVNRGEEQPEIFGLVPLLRVIRNRIGGLLSTEKILPWWKQPDKGIAELIDADTVLEGSISTNATGITALQEQLDALQAQVDGIPAQFGVIVARGRIVYDPNTSPQWQIQGNARNIVSVNTGNNRYVNVTFPSVAALGGFQIEEVLVQPWTPNANLTPTNFDDPDDPFEYDQTAYPGRDEWVDDDTGNTTNNDFDGSTNLWRVWATGIGQNESKQTATVFMEGLDVGSQTPRTVWGSFQITAIGRKVSAV